MNNKSKPFCTCCDRHEKNHFYADVYPQNKEVTGSCARVSVTYSDQSSATFIVDLGMFQEADYHNLNDILIFNPKEINFAVATHVHMDHVARFPMAVHQGMECKIYTTLGSQLLMFPALDDNYKIQLTLSERQNTRMPYNVHDVEKVEELIQPCPFHKRTCVYNKNNNKIFITLIQNAHIFGACSVFINIIDSSKKAINFYFTGDYNKTHRLFRTKKIPKDILNFPVNILTESTYGTTFSNDVEKVFEKNIERLMSDENYSTGLIPVFSLDRAQNILYILKQMQEKGTLDKNITIYYDGKLSKTYSDIIYNNSDIFNIPGYKKDFLPYNCQYVSTSTRSQILNNLDKKQLIVTPSGMGSNGNCPFYARYIIPYQGKKKCFMHFVGHQEPRTLGGRLLNAKPNDLISLNGLMLPLRSEVYETQEMSSHATADKLLDLYSKFNKINTIVITHGETETKNKFARTILADKNIKVKDVAVADGETIMRFSSYGMVKTMSVF